MKRILLAFLISVALAAAGFDADARSKGGSSSRPHYSGSKHSNSHGGHFVGGSGKSHKGGKYKNPSSGDQYGKHKP
jgi:hypothetical protein